MHTTQVLGLLTVATTLAMTSFALPASAQRRVCVESETNGRIVCGRVVNDSSYPGYDRDRDRTVDRSDDNFDEDFYLTAYPDVAAAVSQGRLRNAYDHYRRFGRFEGRFPRFNEASYLSKNPDVAAAVRNRKLRSGYEHWRKFGRFENRQL